MKQKNIIANDGNIKEIVESEIARLGNFADLNHIDVSQVTDMKNCFSRSKFNGDISNWNVSNVETMRNLFRQSQFNGDISKWDISKVENMNYMFYDSEFNKNISNWNISNVTGIELMFERSKFRQDISKWNFNPNAFIDGDLGRVLENSHIIRRKKECDELKLNLAKRSTDKNAKSL